MKTKTMTLAALALVSTTLWAQQPTQGYQFTTIVN